jgi:hypothetical protein
MEARAVMPTSEQTLSRLSALQRETIVRLGSSGPGGDFNIDALYDLFRLGLIEIRSIDRCLVLTEIGKIAYAKLSRLS